MKEKRKTAPVKRGVVLAALAMMLGTAALVGMLLFVNATTLRGTVSRSALTTAMPEELDASAEIWDVYLERGVFKTRGALYRARPVPPKRPSARALSEPPCSLWAVLSDGGAHVLLFFNGKLIYDSYYRRFLPDCQRLSSARRPGRSSKGRSPRPESRRECTRRQSTSYFRLLPSHRADRAAPPASSRRKTAAASARRSPQRSG